MEIEQKSFFHRSLAYSLSSSSIGIPCNVNRT